MKGENEEFQDLSKYVEDPRGRKDAKIAGNSTQLFFLKSILFFVSNQVNFLDSGFLLFVFDGSVKVCIPELWPMVPGNDKTGLWMYCF